MVWQRSDKISFSALILSIIALLVSTGMSLLIYWDQGKEKLAVSLDSDQSPYLHTLTIRKDKNLDSYIKTVARWYKIQLYNKSKKTISITKITISSEGNNNSESIEGPIFKNVKIDDSVVKISSPIRLPIQMIEGQAVSGFILLPIDINPRYGKILLNIMRDQNNPVDTQIESIIYNPGFLESYEENINAGAQDSAVEKLGIKTEVSVHGIDLNFPIIKEIEDGVFLFGNSVNDGKFGFIHRHDSYLMAEAMNTIIESDGLTADITSPASKKYEVYIETGSGEQFQAHLSAGINALDPLVQIK